MRQLAPLADDVARRDGLDAVEAGRLEIGGEHREAREVFAEAPPRGDGAVQEAEAELDRARPHRLRREAEIADERAARRPERVGHAPDEAPADAERQIRHEALGDDRGALGAREEGAGLGLEFVGEEIARLDAEVRGHVELRKASPFGLDHVREVELEHGHAALREGQAAPGEAGGALEDAIRPDRLELLVDRAVAILEVFDERGAVAHAPEEGLGRARVRAEQPRAAERDEVLGVLEAELGPDRGRELRRGRNLLEVVESAEGHAREHRRGPPGRQAEARRKGRRNEGEGCSKTTSNEAELRAFFLSVGVDRGRPGWYDRPVATTHPSVSRVGLIGDVHGEDRRLERALEFFAACTVDRVLVAGDLVDGYGDVERTLALLEDARVDAIRGNHERWFLAGEERARRLATPALSVRARRYLESLPPTRRYETPRGGLLLGHGVGEDDMAFLRPETSGYALQDIDALRELMLDPEIQYYAGGHTHVRMVRVFTGLVVVNAGTILRDDDPVVAIVDFEREEVEFHASHEDSPPTFLERLALPRPAPLEMPVFP